MRARTALSAIFFIACLSVPPVSAGPQTQAAKEAAEYLVRKLGKKATGGGTAKLAARIERLSLKYGDQVVLAAKKAGPRGLRAIEDAGRHSDVVARLLSREGDRALWIVENPKRLDLFVSYGDDAANAMLKHRALAEPLLSQYGKTAARALTTLDARQARRLAMMGDGTELARLGRTNELLDVIARYGNRGMDFIWRNKKSLAVTSVLAAFLANPQPFIDGTLDLARDVGLPVAETIGSEVASRTDWTRLGGLAVILLGCLVGVRIWRRRTVAFHKQAA